MAESITMPKLGFDMREGILVRWVKNEGEAINKGDILAEIETDKATVEVESHAAGVVRKLFGSQGDAIPVGSVMAIVGAADEKIDDLIAAAGGGSAPAAAAPAPAAPETPQAAPPPAAVSTPAPTPTVTAPAPAPAAVPAAVGPIK